MARRKFFSRLFFKEIKTDDPDYNKIVYAEALYQHFELLEKNCDCKFCIQRKEKLHKYLKDNYIKKPGGK